MDKWILFHCFWHIVVILTREAQIYLQNIKRIEDYESLMLAGCGESSWYGWPEDNIQPHQASVGRSLLPSSVSEMMMLEGISVNKNREYRDHNSNRIMLRTSWLSLLQVSEIWGSSRGRRGPCGKIQQVTRGSDCRFPCPGGWDPMILEFEILVLSWVIEAGSLVSLFVRFYRRSVGMSNGTCYGALFGHNFSGIVIAAMYYLSYLVSVLLGSRGH